MCIDGSAGMCPLGLAGNGAINSQMCPKCVMTDFQGEEGYPWNAGHPQGNGPWRAVQQATEALAGWSMGDGVALAGGRKAEGPQSLRAHRRAVCGCGFGRSERWAAQAHAFKAPVGFGSNAGAALWLPLGSDRGWAWGAAEDQKGIKPLIFERRQLLFW